MSGNYGQHTVGRHRYSRWQLSNAGFHGSALPPITIDVAATLDGLEAIERYQRPRGTIARVLSNIGLSMLNGYEGYCNLREMDTGVNMILTSGEIDRAT